IASVSGLSAARFARSAARAAGDARRLLHAVARWRLAAVGTVLVQLPPKVRDLLAQGRVLHPQNFNLALQRRNQVPNLGSENHPYLDSYFPIPRPKKSWPFTLFHEDCCQSDSPQLVSYPDISLVLLLAVCLRATSALRSGDWSQGTTDSAFRKGFCSAESNERFYTGLAPVRTQRS